MCHRQTSRPKSRQQTIYMINTTFIMHSTDDLSHLLSSTLIKVFISFGLTHNITLKNYGSHLSNQFFSVKMSWNISWGYIKLTSRTERIITKNVSGEKDIELNDLKTKHREPR